MTKNPEHEIDELNRELLEARSQRDRLNEEAHKWAEKRDNLHGEIRKLRLQVNDVKEKRDALNSEVQKLKTLREEAKAQCQEKTERLKKLRQDLGKLQAKRPQRSSVSLKKEIEEVEWKIQTSSLSLDEEKKMVEHVKNLEVRLEVYRQMEDIKNEITELENEWKALKDDILACNEKISGWAGHSQEFHQKLIEKLESIRKLKVDADEMHKKYVENREAAKPFHLKYTEILDQIKSLEKAIRQKEEEEKTKRMDDLQKKLERDALDKLKRGEKLSFEEFKVLAEQGKI